MHHMWRWKTSAFFRFDWKAQRWNLVVVLGAVIGGYIAANFMTNENAVPINSNTIEHLRTLGFESAGTAPYLTHQIRFETHVF